MARYRILIVDDEEDILTALKAYLEGTLDAEVQAAPGGREALAIVAGGSSLDLIISDYRMPAMNGLEFLTAARKTHPDVPRVLLTAYPDMDLAIRALNDAAISQFLTKPVQPEKLLEVVTDILQKSRQARQSRQALERAAGQARPKAGP